MENKEWPILYKKSESGKILSWAIETKDNIVIVTQGFIDGTQQVHEDVITEGKNIGRSNETTPITQAQAEAQSKWDKKLKRDTYKLTLEEAEKQTTKVSSEGGFKPMLAQDGKKHLAKKGKYPIIVQPKLDGLRCIAQRLDDGDPQLFFRSGKECVTLPKVTQQLKKIMDIGEIFDGELYIHGEDFNTFTGAIRANKNLNQAITDRIQYWIYDVPRIEDLVESDPFTKRVYTLINRVETIQNSYGEDLGIENLKFVRTEVVDTFDDAMLKYKEYVSEGYEGMMFRNVEMPYEQKRSYNLMKWKNFVEAEFEIVGFSEGKGRLQGKLATFTCIIPEGVVLKKNGFSDETVTFSKDNNPTGKNTFEATPKMTLEKKEELFGNPESFMGKQLTVKYFELSEYQFPRFPIGKTVRWDK